MKILLTGGHAAATATATIYEIKKSYPNSNLYWVGPKSAVEGKYVPTHASKIMPTLHVEFIPIITGRLQRKFTIWTIPSLLKIPYGILSALQIVRKIKPEIIVSFGGYASVPVCFAGWIFRIPVVIHEQTSAVGLANKITSFFATKVLLAREESIRFFPSEKIVLIGNPVNEEIAKIRPKAKLGKPVTIYVTGGSSGAQRINNVIDEILYELLKNYKIIHQTGKLDFDKFLKRKQEFPADLKTRYEVYDFIDPVDIPTIFEKSDVIISRAGANTLSEISVTRRPAILIPIPWTSNDEQTKNAKMLVNTGLAIMIEEKDLNGEFLLQKIDFVIGNWKKMTENADNSLAELDKNAAKKFVGEIEKLLK